MLPQVAKPVTQLILKNTKNQLNVYSIDLSWRPGISQWIREISHCCALKKKMKKFSENLGFTQLLEKSSVTCGKAMMTGIHKRSVKQREGF